MKHCLISLCLLTFAIALNLTSLQADEPDDKADQKKAEESMPMVYELRTYTTEPGKLSDLHARFRNHTMKLFQKHGMTNVIYWTPVDKPETLVYLLAHKSAAAGQESFAAFRADPEWKKAMEESHKNGVLVKKVESLYLQPIDYTPAKTMSELLTDKPDMLYELRVYTTLPGRLEKLNGRFRDHTTKLFEKHGMTNLLYTTPIDEKLKENTLVYFLAHKDQAAADASWKAFISDPAWKEVAAASQADGPILIDGGVKRMYLKPTDYSPIP